MPLEEMPTKFLRTVDLTLNGIWCGWADAEGRAIGDVFFVACPRPWEVMRGLLGIRNDGTGEKER